MVLSQVEVKMYFPQPNPIHGVTLRVDALLCSRELGVRGRLRKLLWEVETIIECPC